MMDWEEALRWVIAALFWSGSILGGCLTFAQLAGHLNIAGLTALLAMVAAFPNFHYVLPLYVGVIGGDWLPIQVTWGTAALCFVMNIVPASLLSGERPRNQLF